MTGKIVRAKSQTVDFFHQVIQPEDWYFDFKLGNVTISSLSLTSKQYDSQSIRTLYTIQSNDKPPFRGSER